MVQELIKPVIKVGNSAGVLVPKKWLNGKAHVELVEKPVNILNDVLEILGSRQEDVVGIYVVGSYARNEQKEKSDIDILVITNKTEDRIERANYNIILIPKDRVEKILNENILPLLPMIKEAKPLLNSALIDKYKNTKLTKKNLRFHIETTKSALKVIKEAVDLAKIENENISDNIIYSLILRLREVYIVDCLLKNKISTTKGVLSLIENLTGSRSSYDAYIRSKKGKKTKKLVSIKEANEIYRYIDKRIKEQESG